LIEEERTARLIGGTETWRQTVDAQVKDCLFELDCGRMEFRYEGRTVLNPG
jgi:hypothetical protein